MGVGVNSPLNELSKSDTVIEKWYSYRKVKKLSRSEKVVEKWKKLSRREKVVEKWKKLPRSEKSCREVKKLSKSETKFKYYPLDQSVTSLNLLYDLWLAMSMKNDPFFAVVKQHLKWNNPYLNQWPFKNEFFLKLCQSLTLHQTGEIDHYPFGLVYLNNLFLISNKLFWLHFRFIAVAFEI